MTGLLIRSIIVTGYWRTDGSESLSQQLTIPTLSTSVPIMFDEDVSRMQNDASQCSSRDAARNHYRWTVGDWCPGSLSRGKCIGGMLATHWLQHGRIAGAYEMVGSYGERP